MSTVCDNQFIGRHGHGLYTIPKSFVPDGTALGAAADKPLTTTVVEFPGAFRDVNGHSTLEELVVIEYNTTDANLTKKGHKWLFFNASPTTTPAADTKYVLAAADLGGSFLGDVVVTGTAWDIDTEPNGFREPTDNVVIWRVRPSMQMRAAAAGTSLWGVMLNTDAVDYDANATIHVIPTIRHHR